MSILNIREDLVGKLKDILNEGTFDGLIGVKSLVLY